MTDLIPNYCKADALLEAEDESSESSELEQVLNEPKQQQQQQQLPIPGVSYYEQAAIRRFQFHHENTLKLIWRWVNERSVADCTKLRQQQLAYSWGLRGTANALVICTGSTASPGLQALSAAILAAADEADWLFDVALEVRPDCYLWMD